MNELERIQINDTHAALEVIERKHGNRAAAILREAANDYRIARTNMFEVDKAERVLLLAARYWG